MQYMALSTIGCGLYFFYYYYYYYSIVIIVIIFYVKSVYGVNMISVFSKGELNPIITVLAGSNKVIPVNNSC